MAGNKQAGCEQLASDEQLEAWVKSFAGYRQPPTKDELRKWLGRFDAEHLSTAHKVLDAVIVVAEREIHQGYRDALTSLPGWSKSPAIRQGRWFFVGVGGAGESGPAMLRMFREANGLTSAIWQSYFKMPRELPRLALTAYDHVVFVDDFAGTGRQITSYWPLMQELVASEATCYLLLTALTEDAERAIQDNTELEIRAPLKLGKAANVFAAECDRFDDNERQILDAYGKIAWAAHPKGFGACGLTLILSHKTPNNTIPILHANHEHWEGLFPRNLLAA
ncbi:hypothetical protein SKP52_14975 [Sphingopyxis fribergensis]|uniref:PRTase-CE domain-containing protein n=1 Tax=Sphingopyxis fribergensis TaxID=1515612 RepID=A0A0A7PPM0_9SPHN|nr:hypothetical protein [Sphingopyxis fribergensis]AJA09877.1 hypothetical protein SKP52_14975 [Sphingopyxis fribergensis]